MTACRHRLEELRCRARAQVNALGVLEKAFAQEAEHLCRHDQAQHLDDLGARVAQEVAGMQAMEAAASYSFTKETLISGLTKFAVGTLLAATRGTQEHPLSIGAKLAADDFARTEPFGTVLVALGPASAPDEVSVISLSRFARELGRSESEIRARIEGRGYRLMTPVSFFRALDRLKEHVLKGVPLPVANDSLLLKPAEGDPNDSPRAEGDVRLGAE